MDLKLDKIRAAIWIITTLIACVPIAAMAGGNPQSPEINVTGNTIDIPHGDISPITADGTAFGAVELSTGKVSHVFVIEDTANIELIISSIAISGAAAVRKLICWPAVP